MGLNQPGVVLWDFHDAEKVSIYSTWPDGEGSLTMGLQKVCESRRLNIGCTSEKIGVSL